MNEASKLCSYDQEYLSLLARQGKLRADKISGKWYTKIQWLNEYLSEKRPNMIIGDNFKSEKKQVDSVKSPKKMYLALLSINLAVFCILFYLILNSFQELGGNGGFLSSLNSGLTGEILSAFKFIK